MAMNRRVSVLCKHLVDSERVTAHRQQTCGIIAMVGNGAVSPVLVEGLRILEARGYDSAGISTILNGELLTTKFASTGTTNNAIDILAANVAPHKDANIGIAHTRWATHGGATDNNAHPHQDNAGRIAVCHNGVIENYAKLKKMLKDTHKIQFHSDTDTEVIAQLIGLHVREGMSTLDATRKALESLRGTWGLVIMDKQAPDRLIVAKNGSPMVIGVAEGKTFVSSEPTAFGRYTKGFISLEDNEIAIVTAAGHSLETSRTEKVQTQNIELTPDPYPHWTLKEIMEQPESLARALNYGARLLGRDSAQLGGLSANAANLSSIRNLVVAACGTSYYAALMGAHFMNQLEAFDTVQVIDAAELEEFHFPNPKTGGLLVISQSGETKDVHRALQLGQSLGVPCLSVVNAVGSLIARSSACGIYLNAGRENAVASTKAFTSQATVLSLLSLWFSKQSTAEAKSKARRKVFVDALQRLPTSVGMVLSQDTRDRCKAIATKLNANKVEHMFILGKGSAMPIALEGALKIKEISYIHAEGYPGGALKHGPFALIESTVPVIFIVLNDHHAPKMKVAVEEVQARGAQIITITDIPNIWKGYSKDMGDVVTITSNGPLTCISAIIPLQLLAYELSVLAGVNPDRPRHLAKTVTVD